MAEKMRGRWLGGSMEIVPREPRFVALATVGVYIPTCIYALCAHFAEVIVKAYIYEIQGTEPVIHPPDFRHARANIIEIHGASLPYITWDQLHHTHPTNTSPEILNTILSASNPSILQTKTYSPAEPV